MGWRDQDLRDLIREGKVTSLDDLLDSYDYGPIESEIHTFLTELAEKNVGRIDTIVGMERKGSRILRNFFTDNPRLNKYNITTDGRVTKTYIEGMNILIFDDSLHEGNGVLRVIKKISRYGPASIAIACLLYNEEARERIASEYPSVSITPCRPVFKTYEEQSMWIYTWEMPYLNHLKVKDNPDYPTLIMKMQNREIDKIKEILFSALGALGKITDNYHNGSTHNPADFVSFSIEIDAEKMLPDLCKHMIFSKDGSKIRCFITRYPDRSEVEIIPLINPRFTADGCQILDSTPERCLAKKKACNVNEACGTCLFGLVNREAIDRLLPIISELLQDNGVFVYSKEIEEPELRHLSC